MVGSLSDLELAVQAWLVSPTVQAILQEVVAQLVMWPSTYMTISPVYRAGRVSRRVYYGLLAVSILLAVGCSVVYILWPEFTDVVFIGTSVAAIIVEMLLLKVKFTQLLLLFFSAELSVYCVSSTAKAISLALGEQEARLGLTGSVVQWAMILVLLLFFSRVFSKRIGYVLKNGQVANVVWQGGWAVPLAMYVLEVLFTLNMDDFESIWRAISTSSLFLIVYFVLIELMYQLVHTHMEMEQRANDQRLLELQLERSKSLRRQIDEAQRARHDMRHFQRVVASVAEKGDLAVLRSFASELNDEMREDGPLVWSTNATVDALVGHYVERARELGCDVTADIRVAPEAGISEMQLTALLGNALENAVEALEGAGAGGAGGSNGAGGVGGSDGAAAEKPRLRIGISGGPDEPFRLDVRNTTVGTAQFDDEGRALSTKHEGEGMGTQIISSIARSNGGVARFSQKDDVFRTFVLIPRQQARE